MSNWFFNNGAVFLLLLLSAQASVQIKHTHRLDDGDPAAPKPLFECLNGKNPADLTKKEILAEFSKGKCAPLILVPGLLSTKLVVQITDCTKLQKEFPELFAVCGFVRCPEKWEEIGPRERGVPMAEYLLWIPDILSPLSIFTYKENNNYCFAKFAKQNIDFTKPVEDSVIENDAFKIRLFGNTPATKSFFQCGDGATQNLIPLGSHFQKKETRAFLAMHGLLRSRGYIAGLTYQTLPYDFMRSYRANTLREAFKEAVDRLYALSNKKVVIMGHSLGNVNILHQLNRLSPEDKAQKIKLWIAAGPPFLGAIKMNKGLLSGEDDFIFMKNLVGLKLRPGIEGLGNIQISYILTAKDPFSLYKDEKWFAAIQKRTQYEEGKGSVDESGFAFLPPTTAECSPKNFFTFAKNCTLGLYDTSKAPMARILNETYTLAQQDELYGRWNTTVNASAFIKHNNDLEFLKLANPGVPMAVVMVRTQPTIKTLTYRHNITQFIMRNTYYYPDIATHYGDGTVPAWSQVIPPLKWAWEFDHKSQDGVQPVKIVDMCSNYNRRESPFDTTDANGVKHSTKNDFISIGCECMKSRNPQPCAHAAMISDQAFLNFLGNSLQTGENGLTDEHRRHIEGLTDEYLTRVSEECPTVKF
jgi:hypothetical protein